MKQVRCLLGGKEYVWIDTWASSERESCPHGSLNHLCEAFLLGFLGPIILLCLILNPCLIYLTVLPCVWVHLLVKMESSKEVYGYLTSLARKWHPLSFDLQVAFLHMCSWEALLNFKNVEYILPFISYLGRVQPPPLAFMNFCFYGVSVHSRESVQPGAPSSPPSGRNSALSPLGSASC